MDKSQGPHLSCREEWYSKKKLEVEVGWSLELSLLNNWQLEKSSRWKEASSYPPIHTKLDDNINSPWFSISE